MMIKDNKKQYEAQNWGGVCVHMCVFEDESDVSTGYPKLNTLDYSLECSSGTQGMAELKVGI